MNSFIYGAAIVLMSAMPVLAEEVMEKPQWGYVGEGATAHWAELDPAYRLCKDGLAQSPVNIARFLQEEGLPLSAEYSPVPLSILNDGRTIKVNFEAGGAFGFGGEHYNAMWADFHTPSEHYFDGAPYPMEAHVFHKGDDGRIVALAVMMKIGRENEAIEKIWSNVAASGAVQKVDGVQVSVSDLLPAELDYYSYKGSLTTPPCHEGLQWFVLKKPIEISERQLRAFQSVFPVNARPVQPLNTRVITGN